MVQMNWFAGQKLRHRRREQTYGHQGGKAAGGGVMNWEIGIDIYTLIYIKWITNKNLLYKKINKIKLKKKRMPGYILYSAFVSIFLVELHMTVKIRQLSLTII